MFNRVDDLFFNVDDMEQALAFYRESLGLPVKVQTADWVELDAGNVTIALRRFGSGSEGRPELGVGGGATPVFEVDDVEAARTELEGKGVEYGSVNLAAFKDVSGNLLEISAHVR